MPRYYEALKIYKYHKGDNPRADPKWADSYLLNLVRDGHLTQQDIDSIRHECGEAFQNPLISTGLKG